MRAGFRGLAEYEFDKDLRPFYKARSVAMPEDGWLRQLRRVTGVSVADVARKINVTPGELHRIERAEKKGTITLNGLRKAAGAIGCDVVYAIVPRERTVYSKAADMGERYLWKKRFRRRW
jgi:predicted DNA-binding mobile mystery protein A